MLDDVALYPKHMRAEKQAEKFNKAWETLVDYFLPCGNSLG